MRRGAEGMGGEERFHSNVIPLQRNGTYREPSKKINKRGRNLSHFVVQATIVITRTTEGVIITGIHILIVSVACSEASRKAPKSICQCNAP